MVFIAYSETSKEGRAFNVFDTMKEVTDFAKGAVAQGARPVRIYRVDRRHIGIAKSAIPRGDLFAIQVIAAAAKADASPIESTMSQTSRHA